MLDIKTSLCYHGKCTIVVSWALFLCQSQPNMTKNAAIHNENKG